MSPFFTVIYNGNRLNNDISSSVALVLIKHDVGKFWFTV